ncbi:MULTISPECIES: glycine oxidase ThiO [Pseudomonas]|uniref:glycine oxidase ThiO n=1 Tax=Pseudomonas TaxID=286 RepID=UPI0005A8A70E|nr:MULTISPECIES: glycine oxidase ThiO [Pseudomonas]AZD94982.1 Glycine oxidase ThiO [Pseudomonas chlororaphis subsp. aureofaciens]AZE01313.1 Glycine oxidase ThiO [Pseudomonas chlororaphis subsp. aureofaciens]AZE07434.1 Glycine oxidase ThiO [Pseudomonas chlororaphis subsp. aureofaciens]AZE38472.1 Glycine oxidase ThiO [Pseudomonas chlororaphis subsp. aureofaciens]KAB0536219.1 glycine oxidase ThiO [Pseudomonas chlororaphis subsp. aureofaciens]
MAKQQQVVIVGGGVIGLLTAFNLASAGQQVVLLERSNVGQESSWAGGGIVSPLYPWRYSPAVTALAHWSQDFYPQLAERLFVTTGVDPEVHTTGLYWLDLDDEAEALAWAQREQRPLSAVDISVAHDAVPVLGGGFSRAIYMADVANVRNPRLVKSLKAALSALPAVTIHEHCEVSGFIREGERVLGVQTSLGEIRGDQVVLAAGAWSGELLKSLGLALPVEPVKGQMILYKCASDFLSCMVLAKGRYAIPRRDGHILIGSTLEHEGFDKTPTASALESLKASAIELIPALAQAEVVGHWAGLRPGSPEGIPYIGPVPGLEGLWLNCGHYRNGLVLAPASCQLFTDLMLGREPIIDPAPYAPSGRI